MASDDKISGDAHLEQDDSVQTQENALQISPVKRKRLQQLFDHGTLQYNQKNYDYATELLYQCVIGDPGNILYLQRYMDNLKDKYGKNKRGHSMAFLRAMGSRGATKKAFGKEDWIGTIKSGCEALQWNPWDVATLTMLWKASVSLGFTESPLVYLKSALEANPKDPEVNRTCAGALEELGRLDEAIACWRRVAQAFPNGSEDADKNITRITLKRTLRESAGGAVTTKSVTTKSTSGVKVEITQEEFLLQQLRAKPRDTSVYLKLADLYIETENFASAADILKKGLESCEHSDELQDRLDDVETRLMRQQLMRVEKKFGKDSEQWRKLRRELNQKEIEIWVGRCQRYPNNLAFKYDLGQRYQIGQDYDSAIKQYQMAKKEPRRQGVCALALGQCFQAIKQHRLAMANYIEAIEVIPDRDADNKKRAYYRAGKLSMELNELEQAEKFFTLLADLDFSYKDVPVLLEKIAEMRHNNDS